MSLINLFFIKLWKFLVICLICVCMTFYFTTQMALGHLLSTIPTIKKLECKDHQIYSKIMRNIYKKRKSNLNFIRIIKNSSFWLPIYTDIPIVQTFLKILWWRFLAPRSTYFDFVNISIYNLLTHTLHWSVQLRFSVFLSITSLFWSFIV